MKKIYSKTWSKTIKGTLLRCYIRAHTPKELSTAAEETSIEIEKILGTKPKPENLKIETNTYGLCLTYHTTKKGFETKAKSLRWIEGKPKT